MHDCTINETKEKKKFLIFRHRFMADTFHTWCMIIYEKKTFFMILFLFSFETNKWGIVVCFCCCVMSFWEDKQISFFIFRGKEKALMSPHVGFMTMWFWVKLHFKSFSLPFVSSEKEKNYEKCFNGISHHSKYKIFYLLSITKIPVTHGHIKEWPLSVVLLFSSLLFFFCEYECLPLCTYLGHIIYYFLNNFFILLVLNGILSLIFPIHETERNGKNVFHCFFCSMLCVTVSCHAFFPHQRYFCVVFFQQKFKSRVVLVSCFSFYHPISSSQVFFFSFPLSF